MAEITNSENNKTLDVFSNCHVGIVSMLREMADLPDLIAHARRLKSILPRVNGFFHEVVKTHHQEEEEQLFPAVLASASPGDEAMNVQQLTSRLTAEHREIERAFMILLPEIKMLEKDPIAMINEGNLISLVDLYLAHAKFEEDAFLPLAQTILGRNSNHMAALGLSIHLRHDIERIRRTFGGI